VTPHEEIGTYILSILQFVFNNNPTIQLTISDS